MPKFHFLIKKCDDAGIKHLKNDPKAFKENLANMDDIYNNINYYNPTKNRKIVTVFDDMIADVMTNKKFQAAIKYLFFKCREMNISIEFITQDYFSVQKEFRLDTTLYLTIKNYNKREKKVLPLITH